MLAGEKSDQEFAKRNTRPQLDPKRYTRINRSSVMNIDRISEIHAMFNGEYELLLDDGTKLNVSRGYKDRLFTC